MKRQRGVALISALLIVALATTLAVMVSQRASLRLRDSENARDLSQAVATARGAVDFGRWALRRDLLQDRQASKYIDHLGENWAQSLPAFPVEGGSVSGAVRDVQGLINLNNLGLGQHTPVDQLVMASLLAQFNLDPALANALTDWVDTDKNVTLPGGAEESDYLALDPARRPANQALADVDELLRVRGFTPAMVKALRPFVCALPKHTPVNINTAPAAVIAALFQVSASDAEAFLKVRAAAPFSGDDDLRARAPAAIRSRLGNGGSVAQPGGEAPSRGGQLSAAIAGAAATQTAPRFNIDWSVSSQYFQIDAHASYGRVQYGLSALVWRDQSNTAYPAILWERRTLF